MVQISQKTGETFDFHWGHCEQLSGEKRFGVSPGDLRLDLREHQLRPRLQEHAAFHSGHPQTQDGGLPGVCQDI